MEAVEMYCINRECGRFMDEQHVFYDFRENKRSSYACSECGKKCVTDDDMPNKDGLRQYWRDVEDFYRVTLKQGHSHETVKSMYQDFRNNHTYWKEVRA